MSKEIREYYNQYSDAYLNEYGPVFQAALFAPDWKDHCEVMMQRGMILPGCSVLDVGCGVGGVMKGLKDNGVKDLLGVTISSRQVELAGQIDPDLDIELSDFMQWEDQGRRFDRIILCESFGYFPEAGKLIEKVRGLLNPGGMIYVKDLCAVPDPDLLQQAGLNELEDLWNYRNYTCGEMTWLWGQAGFSRIGGDDNLWRISDCRGFVNFISGNSDLSRKHFPSVGQVPIKASDFLFI
jgi:SAM-dependent methyltransferase